MANRFSYVDSAAKVLLIDRSEPELVAPREKPDEAIQLHQEIKRSHPEQRVGFFVGPPKYISFTYGQNQKPPASSASAKKLKGRLASKGFAGDSNRCRCHGALLSVSPRGLSRGNRRPFSACHLWRFKHLAHGQTGRNRITSCLPTVRELVRLLVTRAFTVTDKCVNGLLPSTRVTSADAKPR